MTCGDVHPGKLRRSLANRSYIWHIVHQAGDPGSTVHEQNDLLESKCFFPKNRMVQFFSSSRSVVCRWVTGERYNCVYCSRCPRSFFALKQALNLRATGEWCPFELASWIIAVVVVFSKSDHDSRINVEKNAQIFHHMIPKRERNRPPYGGALILSSY